MRFRKPGFIRRQGAKHLIGADVQKPKALGSALLRPVVSGRFQQVKRAHHIGLQKLNGRMNRAVHMGLGGEVDDGPGLVQGQQFVQEGTVPNVALYKGVASVPQNRLQIGQVPGIGQLVHIDDGLLGAFKPGVDKVAADEARATSD